MRVLIAVFIFLTISFASNFKYKVYIDSSMPEDKIINTIENAPDGTVVVFEKGEYNFNNIITLTNKHFISIVGDRKDNNNLVNINNLKMNFNNSDGINIININFLKSDIVFKNSKHIVLGGLNLWSKSTLNIDSSTGELNSIFTKEDYKNFPIIINNSNKIKIVYLTIYNSIFISNSYVDIFKSYIYSNNNTDSIIINNSKVLVDNSKFYNNIYKDNYKDIKKIVAYIVANNNSKLIVKANTFDNLKRAVDINNSKGYISNNIFRRFNIAIASGNSQINIKNNKFKDGLYFYNKSILLNNSIGNIEKNDFSKYWRSVYLKNSSQANIINNTFITPKTMHMDKYRLLLINSLPVYIKYDKRGYGIDVENDCMANIINNRTVGFEYPNLGWASKKSKIYLKDNDKEFSLPGLFNPQKSDKKLTIENPTIDDFSNIFKDIDKQLLKHNNFETKSLVNLEKAKKDPKNLKKGYLTKSIFITRIEKGESWTEEIPAGTYMEFNLFNHTILKPNEYKGIHLSEVPKLETTPEQRKIKIIPKHKIISNNIYLLTFDIKSNTTINQIKLDGNNIELFQDNGEYSTNKIRITNFNKTYNLVLSGDNFEIKYQCKFDSNQNLNCKKTAKAKF